jgi:hypothetical protein
MEDNNRIAKAHGYIVGENTVAVIARFVGGILNLLVNADRHLGKKIHSMGFWLQLQRNMYARRALSWSSPTARYCQASQSQVVRRSFGPLDAGSADRQAIA